MQRGCLDRRQWQVTVQAILPIPTTAPTAVPARNVCQDVAQPCRLSRETMNKTTMDRRMSRCPQRVPSIRRATRRAASLDRVRIELSLFGCCGMWGTAWDVWWGLRGVAGVRRGGSSKDVKDADDAWSHTTPSCNAAYCSSMMVFASTISPRATARSASASDNSITSMSSPSAATPPPSPIRFDAS